jgi:hypothetical protein
VRPCGQAWSRRGQGGFSSAIGDVPLADVRFERRIEVKSRTDALIGPTIFEAKRDLAGDWEDVERKMPDDLANREGRGFPGYGCRKILPNNFFTDKRNP